MINLKIKTAILTLVFLFLVVLPVFAGIVPCTDNCTIEMLFTLPTIVIDFILANVVPGIVIIGVLWSAIIMMTSAGDSAKFETGKRTITYIVVGMIVIYLSWTLVGWFIDAIGGNSTTIFP